MKVKVTCCIEDDPDQPSDPMSRDEGMSPERLAAYERGEWWWVGIRAKFEFRIPSKQGGYWNLQTIKSPGLWGVESDVDKDYLQEIYREEVESLKEQIAILRETPLEYEVEGA